MRIGFCASAGGLKLVAAAGIAEAAEEAGIWSDVAAFSAASGGAPWCALLATGLEPAEVSAIARDVELSDYWRPNWWSVARIAWLSAIRRQAGATLGEVGVDDGHAMERWLQATLPVHTFEALAHPFAVPVAVPNLRRTVTLTSGPLLPAIRATTAIPGAYKPVTMTINGRECKAVDGGVSRPIPVSDLLDLEPELDVVLAVVACNRGDDSPYVRARKMDLFEYADALLDTLVYDHIQQMLRYSAEKVPIILLPVRLGADMMRPRQTIPPALMAARQQGREFFASDLWHSVAVVPHEHAGRVYTFE